MLKRILTAGAACMLLVTAAAPGAYASEADAPGADYDRAVNLLDNYEAMDVSIMSAINTFGSDTKEARYAEVTVSGMKDGQNLSYAIIAKNEDGSEQDPTLNQYYTNGNYYCYSDSGVLLSMPLVREEALELLNSYVYLDFDSEYLSELHSAVNEDSTVTYSFMGNAESVLPYMEILGSAAGIGGSTVFDVGFLTGTVTTGADGKIRSRILDMVLTVSSGDSQSAYQVSSSAVFNKLDDEVTVSFPDLSAAKADESAVAMSENLVRTMSGTMYCNVEEVNVRESPSTSANRITVLRLGQPVEVTGYVSGWFRIDLGGRSAYVSDQFLSWDKPDTRSYLYVTGWVTSMDPGTFSVNADGVNMTFCNWNVDSESFMAGDTVYVTYYVEDGMNIATGVQVLADNTDSTGGFVNGTVVYVDDSTLQLRTDGGNLITFGSRGNDLSDLCPGDYIGVSYAYYNGSYGVNSYEIYRSSWNGTEDSTAGIMTGTIAYVDDDGLTLYADDGRTLYFANRGIDLSYLSSGYYVTLNYSYYDGNYGVDRVEILAGEESYDGDFARGFIDGTVLYADEDGLTLDTDGGYSIYFVSGDADLSYLDPGDYVGVDYSYYNGVYWAESVEYYSSDGEYDYSGNWYDEYPYNYVNPYIPDDYADYGDYSY